MTKPLEILLYPEALKLAARKKKKKGLLFRVMHVNHSKRMGTLLRMVRRRLFQNQKKGRGYLPAPLCVHMVGVQDLVV